VPATNLPTDYQQRGVAVTLPNKPAVSLNAGDVTGSLPVDLTGTAAQNAIAAAVWTLSAWIDGKTPQEAIRIIAAVLAGKVTGAGSGVESFTGLDGATPRVEVTCSAAGNRSTVHYD
jgi:hypothetical protein